MRFTRNGLLPPIARTSSRALNSAGFQPNANRPCLVTYSVRIQGSLTLAGGAAGLVQLMSDSNSTPTTVRAQVRNGQTGTVIIGITVTGDGGGSLSYLVPAGDYVRIVTTNVTATPTFTLEQQVEQDM